MFCVAFFVSCITSMIPFTALYKQRRIFVCVFLSEGVLKKELLLLKYITYNPHGKHVILLQHYIIN